MSTRIAVFSACVLASLFVSFAAAPAVAQGSPPNDEDGASRFPITTRR
jgi:hypothetical protein